MARGGFVDVVLVDAGHLLPRDRHGASGRGDVDRVRYRTDARGHALRAVDRVNRGDDVAIVDRARVCRNARHRGRDGRRHRRLGVERREGPARVRKPPEILRDVFRSGRDVDAADGQHVGRLAVLHLHVFEVGLGVGRRQRVDARGHATGGVGGVDRRIERSAVNVGQRIGRRGQLRDNGRRAIQPGHADNAVQRDPVSGREGRRGGRDNREGDADAGARRRGLRDRVGREGRVDARGAHRHGVRREQRVAERRSSTDAGGRGLRERQPRGIGGEHAGCRRRHRADAKYDGQLRADEASSGHGFVRGDRRVHRVGAADRDAQHRGDDAAGHRHRCLKLRAGSGRAGHRLRAVRAARAGGGDRRAHHLRRRHGEHRRSGLHAAGQLERVGRDVARARRVDHSAEKFRVGDRDLRRRGIDAAGQGHDLARRVGGGDRAGVRRRRRSAGSRGRRHHAGAGLRDTRDRQALVNRVCAVGDDAHVEVAELEAQALIDRELEREQARRIRAAGLLREADEGSSRAAIATPGVFDEDVPHRRRGGVEAREIGPPVQRRRHLARGEAPLALGLRAHSERPVAGAGRADAETTISEIDPATAAGDGVPAH